MAQQPAKPPQANVHQRVYSKSEEPGFIFGCHYENCRKISKRKYAINARYAKKHGNIGHEMFKKMTRDETLVWAGVRRLVQSEKIVHRRETREDKQRAHVKAWIIRRGPEYSSGRLLTSSGTAPSQEAVAQPVAQSDNSEGDEAGSFSDIDTGDDKFAAAEDSGVDLASQLQNELDKRRSSPTGGSGSTASPFNTSSTKTLNSQIMDSSFFGGSRWSPLKIQRTIAEGIYWDPLGHLKDNAQAQTRPRSTILVTTSRPRLADNDGQSSPSEDYNSHDDEDDEDEFDENENIDDFAERRESERARNGAKA